MLELKNIRKEYPAGSDTVNALKGIDLQFRKSEFVSILGPSGCGKTTMLNIIGGLDGYTDGDLIINGKSTKDFKDRDWDSYRNHSIGFVFQSYNLIPHQTVLQNVELALSLSGVTKSERRKRAKKALEEVGLGNQLKKKPAEMSGGQMQRVAIARALVNNPDIILADEPTGALDTETSVQVMEILKNVAKDRLVVMVTHNPELAQEYSTRIIRMLDGKIIDDSSPLSEKEIKTAKKQTNDISKENSRKSSMSLKTSFALSMKNLFTKKGRTMLTSFAGSIGIIGIALIFAVSQGMTTYIDTLQEEALSSYPLTIEAQHMDISTLMESFMDSAESGDKHEKDAVYQKSMIYDMVNSMNTMETNENDLNSFKKYVEEERSNSNGTSGLYEAVNGVQYTYDINMLVFTENPDGTIIQSDSQALMQELLLEYFGMDLSSMLNMSESMGSSDAMNSMSSMSSMGASMNLWQEMLSGDNGKTINPLLEKQYDVIYGSWPDDYNEIVLVVDENNEIDDMTLYALGLKSKSEIDALANAAINGTTLEKNQQKWSFEEISNMEFRVVLNSNCYSLDEKTGLYTDLRNTQTGLKYLYDNGTALKVSGIIRPNEDTVTPMLNGTVGYTHKLTEYIIENSADSSAIQEQLKNKSVDIFTGLPFHENTGNLDTEQKVSEFRNYISLLDENSRAETYVKIMSVPQKSELDAMVSEAVKNSSSADIETAVTEMLIIQMGMSDNDVKTYIKSMSEEDITAIYTEMVTEQIKTEYGATVQSELKNLSQAQLSAGLEKAMSEYSSEHIAVLYDEILEFSESTYEDNLRKLGHVNLESPATVNLYASTFENKEVIEDAIADYNKNKDEFQKITYTDYVGLMMSSVTSIINAITYVLIAFVAISLIVSSIMIGVITLISVQERTKEIGILRAIGASKRNVSRMFNAETVIIGLISGTLGIAITYLLCIPINIIMHNVTGIGNLNAFLPPEVAVALICISVLLTTISGIIPARSAAKKDPVVALRSE